MLPKSAYLHGLAHINDLGPKRFAILQKYFDDDPATIWGNINHWPQKLLPSKGYHQAQEIVRHFDIEKEWEALLKKQIQLLCPADDSFPKYLKEINDPPFALYCRGNLPQQHRPLITVVGTRNISDYGRSVCDYLLPSLIKSGIGIISGLAFGVDAYSHHLAIRHNGYTSAVLASGVDFITPRSNHNLGLDIIRSGGGIFSEFVPGTECQKGGFPRRNRILAGLSPITLIIEAAQKSGAKITARFALDYNRDVATIPGSIFSDTSKGCHDLIKQGAKVITSPADILECFGIDEDEAPQKIIFDLSPHEQKIMSLLSVSPVPLDVLISNSGKNSSELLTILSSLELKGLISNTPGQGYKLNYRA